jgi:hypothetical protein
MQCRTLFSVMRSPEKTCPKCESQRLQTTSVLTPKAPTSRLRVTAPAISSSKDGHPDFESNFADAGYSGASHALHEKTPNVGYTVHKSPVHGRSVPDSRRTRYSSWDSCFLHSASDLATFPSSGGAFACDSGSSSALAPRMRSRNDLILRCLGGDFSSSVASFKAPIYLRLGLGRSALTLSLGYSALLWERLQLLSVYRLTPNLSSFGNFAK